MKAKADITWLLHLIHVTAAAIGAQILCRIKVLGICLKKLHIGNWGSEEDGEDTPPEEDDRPLPATADHLTAPPEKEAEAKASEEKKPEEKKAEKKKPDKSEEPEEPEEPEKPEEPKKPQKPDKYEALFKALDERERKKEEAREKEKRGETDAAASSDDPSEKTARKLQELLEKVQQFWDDEKNRDAVSLIERQLLRLGKHLLPTYFVLEGEIGLKDPAATGLLIGKIYRFYPLYGDHIRVDGVFDRQTVNLYTEVKGRLRLGILAEIALRLLLNKRCRSWLKQLLKKEEPAGNDSGPDARKPEPANG